VTSCVVLEHELPMAVPEKVGGRPLGPLGEAVASELQELFKVQTAGIEVAAVREAVKVRLGEWSAGHKANFKRTLEAVCERFGYVLEGDCISVGEMV
jgi:hypothetical protein